MILGECGVKEGFNLGKCQNVGINGLLIYFKDLHIKFIRSQFFVVGWSVAFCARIVWTKRWSNFERKQG